MQMIRPTALPSQFDCVWSPENSFAIGLSVVPGRVFDFSFFASFTHTRIRSPDLWENAVAPVSVIGTAGEGVDELEVGTGVRQFGGVELGQ